MKQETRQRRRRGEKPTFTHFISIPIGSDDNIKNNYRKQMEQISVLGKLPETDLTAPSMLHVTILMLDLSEGPEKVLKAKQVLYKLQSKLTEEFLKQPLYLTIKGISTF